MGTYIVSLKYRLHGGGSIVYGIGSYLVLYVEFSCTLGVADQPRLKFGVGNTDHRINDLLIRFAASRGDSVFGHIYVAMMAGVPSYVHSSSEYLSLRHLC